MTTTADRASVTLAELVQAISVQRQAYVTDQPTVPSQQCEPSARQASSVLVVGAHPGAGASSVAVAIADALAGRTSGQAVHLVDGAPQDTSGLICAAGHELGVTSSGWRAGRRGAVEVHRPDETLLQPNELPDLPTFGAESVVVDAGWPLRELLTRSSCVASMLRTATSVLVWRATVPGVRRAEAALRDLSARHGAVPVLVAVGARRLPGEVRASFGPLLGTAYEAGRVVLFPAVRRLEVSGVEAHPLPDAVAVAATSLLDLIVPATATDPSRSRPPRWKGPGR